MRWPLAPAWTEKDRQRKRYLGCQAQGHSDCVVKVPDHQVHFESFY